MISLAAYIIAILLLIYLSNSIYLTVILQYSNLVLILDFVNLVMHHVDVALLPRI